MLTLNKNAKTDKGTPPYDEKALQTYLNNHQELDKVEQQQQQKQQPPPKEEETLIRKRKRQTAEEEEALIKRIQQCKDSAEITTVSKVQPYCR